MLLSVSTGILHLILGVYVFRLKIHQKTKKYFLFLSLQLSLWLLIQGFRTLLPIEYRNIALNLNFMPMLSAPFILYLLCTKFEYPEKSIPFWAHCIALIGFCYFSFNCISEKMATLKDPENFIYDINANYHFFVLYLVFWMSLSIRALTRKMLIRRGDFKVRLFLVLIGAVLSLHSTVLFTYFLPLLGIFKPSLSSIGLLVSCIFWGIGILHFDAFEIKFNIIKGEYVPWINRIASVGFLKLLAKMDPMRFIQKNLKARTAITKEILIQDYNLATNTGELSLEKRARILSRKFQKYFK